MGGIVDQDGNCVYLFTSPKNFYGFIDLRTSCFKKGLSSLLSNEYYKLVGPKELTVWRS